MYIQSQDLCNAKLNLVREQGKAKAVSVPSPCVTVVYPAPTLRVTAIVQLRNSSSMKGRGWQVRLVSQ